MLSPYVILTAPPNRSADAVPTPVQRWWVWRDQLADASALEASRGELVALDHAEQVVCGAHGSAVHSNRAFTSLSLTSERSSLPARRAPQE